MKKNSFDIVMDDLIENNSLADLESIFSKLNIKTVYVLREVSKKEDFKAPFEIHKSHQVTFKKAYLLKDLSLLHFYKGDDLLLVESGSLKNNTLISTNKNVDFLKDPLSDKLSFDEQNARSCSQNKIKVVFDINKLRGKDKNQAIKQSSFIINLLKIHSVDMFFVTFAKTKEDLVSIKPILSNLLKNFNLEEATINRFLSKDILKK